jgi:hypothetical protein
VTYLSESVSCLWVRPSDSQNERSIGTFHYLTEAESYASRSTEFEVSSYGSAKSLQIVSKKSHEARSQLHHLQPSVHHKVPWKRFAETCYSHPEIQSRMWQWGACDVINACHNVRVVIAFDVFRGYAGSYTVPVKQARKCVMFYKCVLCDFVNLAGIDFRLIQI